MQIRVQVLAICRLAVPVLATHLGWVMLGTVDLLMLGRVSVEALDASALGRLWIAITSLLGMGLIMGIDPIVAQGHGAKDARAVGLALQHGLVIAMATSALIGGLWFGTEELLVAVFQDAKLAAGAEHYALAQLPGLSFFLTFFAMRQYLLGRGIVWPTLLVVVIANLVNALADWVLIFGKLGMPALGVVGAGLASSLTQAVSVVALLGLVVRFRLHDGAWDGWSREAFAPGRLYRVLKLGSPVALLLTIEVLALQVASLMAGALGPSVLASHAVVINLVGLFFTFQLAISAAATTRVGNLVGQGQPRIARQVGWLALGLGALGALVAATVFLVMPTQLLGIYTKDVAVVGFALQILPIAAAFQLLDGLQTISAGILRGMGRTLGPAAVTLIGYYLLALPLAGWMTFRLDAGIRGVWWGLCGGLTLVAATLLASISLMAPRQVTVSSQAAS